jgi:hypothetical protein
MNEYDQKYLAFAPATFQLWTITRRNTLVNELQSYPTWIKRRSGGRILRLFSKGRRI